jgi:hypothetical protein
MKTHKHISSRAVTTAPNSKLPEKMSMFASRLPVVE